MPRVADLTLVRRLLDRDRPWAAYAIGDLAPGFIDHCEWHADPHESALVLVYRGFTPPIVFAMGAGDSLTPLFAEVRAPEISLHLQPHALPALAAVYEATETRSLHRMVVTPEHFRPAEHDDVGELSEQDLSAVMALYEDGHRRHEGPTFFHASMLRQHTFRGIWEGRELVAIAGTHLYSRELAVCAIGNVYTRGDRRGQGLAARVTSAVVAHATGEGVSTIVLNVGRDNTVAARVYQRLGFDFYGDFLEGEARRLAPAGVDSAP